ncbi:MAG: amidohydrolase family protein [Treponema sp.]|jgi:predicted TIM-barrel fold metal-dependent hydrolase|nr:amidohydrolase family protein [Treponema sp.]
MKIDFHTHVTPPDIIADWQKYACKESYFSALSRAKYNKFAEAEDVIAALEQDENFKFDKAVIFGFAFRDEGLCRYVNDYVIEKVKEHPEKLIGFCVVSPGKKAGREIERCYNAGLKGAGELFPQCFDLENKKATGTVTGACKELALPLLLHTNEPLGHVYPGKSDITPKKIEAFVTDNQDINIILAHWGGGIFIYESMKEISDSFKNVYYDTAITPFLYDARIYRAAKALGLIGKILFGTDFPILPHSRYKEALVQSSLSDEDIKLITGGNAERLLCL